MIGKFFARCLIAAAVIAVPSGAFAQGQKTDALAPGQKTEAQGDAGEIGKRIERLEEQLVDLQSMVGALESLGRTSGGGASQPGPEASGSFSTQGPDGGDMAARVSGLEVQMKAMSSQMTDLLQRFERLEARLGMSGSGERYAGSNPSEPGGVSGPREGREPYAPGPPRNAPSGQAGDFGPVTVEPNRDSAAGPGQRGNGGQGSAGVQPAKLSTAEARSLYDQAYGHMIKREYQAAATYFEQFLKQHPADPLAGQAQFWLGEAAFVSGEYRKAADMFLKGFSNYPGSDKAPESLLKRGISLKRLGEKNAACDSFSELERRFPQAEAVLQRAQAEKRRASC